MRWFRRPRPQPSKLTRVPDDLPRRSLFTEPVRVAEIRVRDPEHLDDGTVRVAFVVTVKDADGRRCPDLAVEARIAGPERRATGETTTDLMGRATFRMAGPAGTYRFEVLDVAAGGLAFDRDAGTLRAETTVAS